MAARRSAAAAWVASSSAARALPVVALFAAAACRDRPRRMAARTFSAFASDCRSIAA